MSKVHEALRRSEKVFKTNSSNRSLESTPPAEEKPRVDIISTESLSNLPFRIRAGNRPEALKSLSQSDSSARPVIWGLKLSEKLVTYSNPRSIVAERFRALKTKLFQMRSQNKNLRTILITSAAPAEGKTLTSLNLSLAIAQEIDQNVLLIDADLRRPSVHKELGLSKDKGLSELLRSDIPVNDVIRETTLPNFFLVQAGEIAEKPTELLNTQKMKSFLGTATERFNWVIVDSPPFVSLADADILSSLVDGVLIVVRAKQTPAAVIAKSKEFVRGKNVLGIVFNGVQDSNGAKYYYYYDQPSDPEPR